MGNRRDHRQAEEALRASEEKYRVLFEDARDAIFLADAETGILVDVNPAGCELINLPKEQIVGMYQSELHPKEDIEKNKELFSEHVQNVDSIMEDILVQRADGTQVPVDISANLIELNGKPILKGVFRDITSRKEAEKALRESEEKFSKAFRSSPNSISISTVKDGIFIDINDRFTQDNGYTRDEVIGKSSKQLGIWVEPEKRDRIIQKLKKKGRVVDEEYLAHTKSGELRTMLFSAELINVTGQECVIAVTTDITERKKLQAALTDEATRRRILVEQSRDGIVVLDQEGKVFEANQRFAEMLGYSLEEIYHLNVWDWEYQYPPEQVKEMLRTVDETGDQFETRHLRKDGTAYDVEISTNGTVFAGQKLIFCVCRDITERKEMEKALKDSEEKFSKAFNASPDMVIISNIKDGTYVDVNDSFVSGTGYRREELIGHTVDEFALWVNPEDGEKMIRMIEKQGNIRNEEFNFRMKSGETRTWLCSVEIINIGAETYMMGVSTDITERKQIEKALRESEEKFAKAFRSVPDTITITTLKDGKFLEVNDSFTSITGYSREELIGRSSTELGFWIKLKDRDRMMKILKEQGKLYNEEFNIRIKSGEIRTWLFSVETINIGGEVCMIGVTTDITERKLTEAALHESEEKFSKAFSSSPSIICIKKLKDGKYIEINESYTRFTGYTREEVIGHTATELGLWADQEEFHRITEMLEEQGSAYNEEIHSRRKSGEIRVGLFSAETINIGSEPCMMLVITDVTERRQAEEALKASQEFNTSLLENSPTQLVVINPDTSIRYVNPKFEQINGWTLNEAVGLKAPYPWWTDELRTEEATEGFKEAITWESGQIESIAQKKSGETYWLDLNWAGVKHNEELQYCIINSLDITERKNMEEALKIREERFSDIAENTFEWIWEIDIKGKYTYSSPVVEKILGYKPEEILKKHFYDMFYPEDKQKLKKAAFEAFEQKQPFHDFINRNIHKNGNVVYLSTSGVPILDADGNLLGYRGVDTDITERQKREHLQQDENYVLTLLGQGAELGELLDAIIHLGEDHDPAIKGSVLLYDPAKQWLNQASGPNLPEEYLKLMEGGIPIGPIMGSCGTAAYRKERVIIPDIADSPLFESAEEVVNTTAKNSMLACWSQPILSSNGELLGTIANYSSKVGDPDPDDIRILEWSARIAAIAIERKQAEEALQESEDKFSKAFRSSPNTIAITTIKDGRFVEVNDSFTNITGYTREEVIGNTSKDINIWAQTKDRDKMLGILKKDGRVYNHEFDFRIKSGEIRTWLFSAELIDIGNEPCMISITIDITELKRAEDAIKESEEKFSKAFHSSPEAISIASLKDGSFLEVNDSYTRMTGYSRKELIGHNASEFNMWVHTKQKERMLKKIRSREKMNNEEYEYRIKSGDIRTVLVSSEYLSLNDEPCALITNTDITERKRTEEALRESEDKFNKAFHASPIITAISSQRNHKYLEVNENFLKFYGFTRDEVIGSTATELGIWGDIEERSRITEMIQKEGRVRDEEIYMRTKSGEIRVLLFSVEKASIGGELCFVAMTVDITGRKQAEEALRMNEERFRLIADNATDLISRIQLTPTIKTDYVSPSCLRITGYKQDEFYNDPNLGLEMIHPEDREFFLKQAASDNKKDQKPIMVRLVRKDGQEIWIEQTQTVISNDNGEHVAMHLIARDITERKQAEEALKESEEKFYKAFHSSPDAIAITSRIDDRFIEINNSYTRITGYTRQEIIGHNILEFNTSANEEDLKKTMRKIKKQGSVHNEERAFSTKEGKIRNGLFSVESINIGGEPCLLSVTTDITERKQVEEKLKKTLYDLEHSSSQLAATNKELETFSYSVSHDLRSPLRSIDGFSQALLEDYTESLDDTGKDYLNRLRTASQKMGELIDGLLKLSRLTRSEMHQEEVNLSMLVQEITSRLHENEPKRQAEFVIRKGLATQGDPELLSALFENLLGNAWKFTSKSKETRIEFGTTKNGNQTTYFINDNGAGFDMTYADKLFGAFQRLHDVSEFPGTGIGLATVVRIINRHGGKIWAEGAVNKGATFYFTLN